nr:antibiotic biosynthesis monooxygenase [Acinetobacter lanii]
MNTLDTEYNILARQLREKAISDYHCEKFESLCEDGREIALSYWNRLDDIHAWHLDAEHLLAQTLGKEKWYSHFSVEICEILRSYQASTTN